MGEVACVEWLKPKFKKLSECETNIEIINFIRCMCSELNLSKRKRMERELVDKYRALIVGILYKKMPDLQAQREDLEQEIWINIFLNIRQCNSNPGGWIRIITNNEITDFIRGKEFRNLKNTIYLDKLIQLEDGGVDILETIVSSDRFYTSLQVLRDIESGFEKIENLEIRKTFELEALGYSGKEIAEVLGVEPSTVRTRLHKNRKIVKEYLIGIGYSSSDIA